ncbi:MAG: efflux RND transporter permease subunit [Sphaerochaetaceae bacterium]
MGTFFSWVSRHRKLILTLVFSITALFLVLALSLSIDTSLDGMIPVDEQVETIKKEVWGEDDGQWPENVYFLVEGQHVFAPETLTAIDNVRSRLKEIPQIGPEVSPFTFATVEKKGTRLATVPLSPHQGKASWTDEEARTFKERIARDDMIRGLVTTPDGTGFLVYYSARRFGESQLKLDRTISEIVHTLDPYCSVKVLGSTFFSDRLSHYLTNNLFVLLGLCLLVILLIYYLSFKAKRAVLIPFSVSLIGIIWTVGTMRLLGYELTIVSIITPCMVLILGSSYSIHVISAYYNQYRDSRNTQDKQKTVVTSMRGIMPTILAACLTTIVGFLSLLVTKISAFREMGIAVSLGIAYCAILSLTYIPAWLSTISPPRKHQLKVIKEGTLSRIVLGASDFVVRRWYIGLLVLVAIFCFFLGSVDKIPVETDYISYFPKNDLYLKDALYFSTRMGSTDPHYISLAAPKEETHYFTRPDILGKVYAYEQALRTDDPDIVHILSFSQYAAFFNNVYEGKREIPKRAGMILALSKYLDVLQNKIGGNTVSMLMNEDGTRMTIAIRYWDSRNRTMQDLDSAKALKEAIAKDRNLLPKDVIVSDWGTTAENLKLVNIIQHDQMASTVISFVMVFLIVCLLFHSLKYGLSSMVPIMIGVMCSYCMMYLFHIPFDVVTIIFGSVTVGTGIDDAIHFMVRFLSQRKRHPAQPFAVQVQHTILVTGRPIMLTSVSIILGMLVLTFASYTPIRYFGFLMAIALLSTTLSTICILPGMMVAFHQLGEKMKGRN